jgi:hypothetical protein
MMPPNTDQGLVATSHHDCNLGGLLAFCAIIGTSTLEALPGRGAQLEAKITYVRIWQ